MVELQESLRRSEMLSAMGTLLAGVAHGVRNPLFGISATLDAFEARFREREDYKRYTDVLRKETERLTELMQELLQYGRPPSEEVSESAIGDVIAQAVQLCEAQAERMKVKLVNEVAKGFARAQMDRARLPLVFQNLIENAIEHSPKGAVVRVRAKRFREDGQNWVRCRIEDSGPGFRVDDLPKVFEPFFTQRRNGTGLGLSIAQRIVEDHKGKISVDNLPEGGAVATVTFPLLSCCS
jgi:signal transduction histidine kinase